MLRMQIQMTAEQVEQLRLLAAKRHVSRSQLIREAVNTWLDKYGGPSREEQKRHALAAAGKFASGRHDVSEEHDHYLGEAYQA